MSNKVAFELDDMGCLQEADGKGTRPMGNLGVWLIRGG